VILAFRFQSISRQLTMRSSSLRRLPAWRLGLTPGNAAFPAAAPGLLAVTDEMIMGDGIVSPGQHLGDGRVFPVGEVDDADLGFLKPGHGVSNLAAGVAKGAEILGQDQCARPAAKAGQAMLQLSAPRSAMKRPAPARHRRRYRPLGRCSGKSP
jgi:hypothetical protein